MKSRREHITEPDEQRWLEVTPRAAVAGGVVVLLLLAAMTLIQPEQRGADDAIPSTSASLQDARVSTLQLPAPDATTAIVSATPAASVLPEPVPSVAAPEAVSASTDDDTRSWATREDVPPSF